MEYIFIILIAAAVFGLCWLVDKGFTKLFRSQAQHMSGLSVRPNKKFGSMGLILVVLGIAAIFTGIAENNTAVLVGAAILILVGAGLVVYYMSTGIYYDDDSFLHTSFGRKSAAYSYKDIVHQQLYEVQGGSTIVELHMRDGSAVQVLSTMDGYKEFLDRAFLGWVRMNNIDIRQGADFHDPASGCWFPSAEEVE